MSIPAKYLHAAGCLLAQVAGEELSRQELDEVAWAGYRRGDGAKVAEALRARRAAESKACAILPEVTDASAALGVRPK